MKKNTESKHFSKSNLRSEKQVPATNRKARNPQLESLEERRMLSAVSMLNAETGIQAETFYVTLNNAKNGEDASTQYVAMHIQGDVSASGITVTDPTPEGGELEILNSVTKDGVTSLLLQMGFGTNYTITVEGVSKENQINVLFTTPGDLDGDGLVSKNEYYSAYGNFYKGLGISQKEVSKFYTKYGINLSTLEFNELLDLDGNGKLDQDEFRMLMKDAYNSGNSDLKIDQTIIVKPTLEDMEINGNGNISNVTPDAENPTYVTSPTKDENGNYSTVLEGTLPPEGTTAILGCITITGETTPIELNMYKSCEAVGYTYTVSDEGVFKLELQSVASDAKITVEMWYDGLKETSQNTFTIQLDVTPPTLAPKTLSTTVTEYTNNNTPTFTVSTTDISQADHDKIISEIGSSSEGIWLVLEYSVNGQAQKLEYKLSGSEFKKNEETGTYVFSYDFTDLKLKDGVYSFTTYTRDVAGNKTNAQTPKKITVDTDPPKINPSSTTGVVNQKEQKLVITVTDDNVKEPTTEEERNALVTLNNGATITSSCYENGSYTYVLNLPYVSNGSEKPGVTFTITDLAGNTLIQTYTYTYNTTPEVAKEGEEVYVSSGKNDEYVIKDIASFFKDSDDSPIDTTRINVVVNGEAVVGEHQIENGDLYLTLNKEATQIVDSTVEITYTDEYGETTPNAVIYTLHVSNDTTAPVVSYESDAIFSGIIDSSVLTTKGEDKITFDVKDNVTGENVITSAKVTIAVVNGQSETIDLTQAKEFDLSELGLKDGDAIKITYSTTDIFGNSATDTVLVEKIVVNNSKPEITKFVTTETVSKELPSFNIEVSENNEELRGEIKYGETKYADVSIDSAGKVTVTPTPVNPLSSDGTYTFTLTIWDNAGNESSPTTTEYIYDKTQPSVTLPGDTITDSEKGKLEITYSDDLSGVTKLTIKQENYTIKDGEPTQVNDTTLEGTTLPENSYEHQPTLEYGYNLFTVTAYDAAGNQTTKTFTVLYNQAPTVKTDSSYYDSSNDVFSQTFSTGSRDESNQIVLDLEDYIDDESITSLKGTVSGWDAENKIIVGEPSVSAGKLTFALKDITSNNENGTATLIVTLTDEYNKTVEFTLEIKYVYDESAPTVIQNNLTIKAGDTAIEPYEGAKNTYIFNASNGFSFDATFWDETGIASYGWKLTDSNSNIIASSGETDLTPNKSDKAEVSFNSTSSLNTTLSEGTYTLTFWGEDTIGNLSTEDEPSVTYTIIVDTTKPEFNGTVTLDGATLTNDKMHTFTISGNASLIEANDCWLVIYATKGDGEPVEIARAQKNDNNNFGTSLTSKTLTEDYTLAEGTYTLTYEVVDAAGNVAEINNNYIDTITIDRTEPEFTWTVNANKQENGNYLLAVENGTDENVKFTFTVTDNVTEAQDITQWYSIKSNNGWSEWTLYPAEGVSREFGDTTFKLKVVDGTENFTESEEITVSYDHAPTASSTLPAQYFDYKAKTVTITIDKGTFTFSDEDEDDTLKYTFTFTAAAGITGITQGWVENFVETDDSWELTFNITDAIRSTSSKTSLGTLTVTATDSYGQTAKATADIYKNNLPVVRLKEDAFTFTQDVSTDTPSYTFNLSGYFMDPDGDEDWHIASATVNGETAKADGKNVTWTPASGQYGNTTMSVTVKDSEGAEATFEIAVTIDWAGIQLASNTHTMNTTEGTGMTSTISFTNGFNKADAWGDYDKSATWTITPTDVSGVKGQDENGPYTSLGSATIENGVITFTPNTYAYGTQDFSVTVNDGTSETPKTVTVTVCITNSIATPIANNYNHPIQTDEKKDASFDIDVTDVLQGQYNNGTDSGTPTLTKIEFNLNQQDQNQNQVWSQMGEDQNSIYTTIEIDGKSYLYSCTINQSNLNWKVQEIVNNNDNNECQYITPTENLAQIWSKLDGEKVVFVYTIENQVEGDLPDGQEKTATGVFTLEFQSIAKAYTLDGEKDCERSQEEKQSQIDLSDLCNKPDKGWAISKVEHTSGNNNISAKVDQDGKITITITVPAYEYTKATFTYTLTRVVNGETETATNVITVDPKDVNFEPTWSKDTDVMNNVYQWTENEEEPIDDESFPSYTLDLSNIIKDSDPAFTGENQNTLTYSFTEGTTNTSTTDVTEGTFTLDNGKLTFTPTNKDFRGTVNITVWVTDTALPNGSGDEANAKTKKFEFKLEVVNTNDAPVAKETIVLNKDKGDKVTSADLTDFFEDADDDKLTITILDKNGEEVDSYIVPDAMISTFTVKVSDEKEGGEIEKEIIVAVNGKTTIEDQSLNVYTSEDVPLQANDTATGKTLAEDITLTSILIVSGQDTVLKEGTVLKEETVFTAGTIIEASSIPTTLQNVKGVSYKDGLLTFGDAFSEENVTLSVEVKLESDWKIYNNTGKLKVSTDSKITKGSELKSLQTQDSLTIQAIKVDTSTVVAIYNATREIVTTGEGGAETSTVVEHTVYLKQSLELALDSTTRNKLKSEEKSIEVFDLEEKKLVETTIWVVSEATEDSTSPFRYIGYDEAGNLSVYYLPYDVNQKRTEQDMRLTFSDDTPMTVKVSTDIVTPFEIVTGIVEGKTDYSGNNTNTVTLTTKDGTSTTIMSETTKSSADDMTFVPYDSITDDTVYSYQVWVRCNLPIFDKDTAGEIYEALAFQFDLTVTISGINEIIDLENGGSDYAGKDSSNGSNAISSGDAYQITLSDNFMYISQAGGSYTNTTYLLSFVNFTASGTIGAEINEKNLTLAAVSSIDSSYGNNYPGIGLSNVEVSGENQTITGGSSVDSSQIAPIDKSAPTSSNSVKGSTAVRDTVVEGNGVYMAVVKEKSDVEASETLRESEAYITEWDSSWVELWVNTQNVGTDIASFDLNLLYNTDYFTATDFEYSSNVKNGNAVAINDANGQVSGIRGDLTNAVVREDGFVLIGRVKLESVGTDNVAADSMNSVSMGLQLSNVLLRNSATSLLEVNEQVYANTKVFASVYDANDDGEVGIEDLVTFARMFGENSIDTTDPRVWALDFDNSGKIDIQDLVSFARNYGAKRDGDKQIQYPLDFFQTWIGETLEMNGDSNVADTLNDAILSWSEKLGEELNIDVKIIVKEYENVEGGCLAETVLLGCDEEGKPNSAIVYLDSDALGMGWYAGESDNVVSDQYDLYSVLLHELGHALGMSPSYDGYNELIDEKTSTYTDENGNIHYVFNGHVVGENDLMNDMIDTGIRHEISDLEAEIVSNARENGGAVDGTTSNAISGATACTLGSNVQNGVLVTTATGMATEETWNAMLVESATKAVLEATVAANDQACDELYQAEAKSSVALTSSASAFSMDDLFDDDDDDDLEEIALEMLRIQLNDQE